MITRDLRSREKVDNSFLIGFGVTILAPIVLLILYFIYLQILVRFDYYVRKLTTIHIHNNYVQDVKVYVKQPNDSGHQSDFTMKKMLVKVKEKDEN